MVMKIKLINSYEMLRRVSGTNQVTNSGGYSLIFVCTACCVESFKNVFMD